MAVSWSISACNCAPVVIAGSVLLQCIAVDGIEDLIVHHSIATANHTAAVQLVVEGCTRAMLLKSP